MQFKICPICKRPTRNIMAITESEGKDPKKGIWCICSCGVVFQDGKPKNENDSNYIKSYEETKEIELRSIHSSRTYLPLIEEIMNGRKVLEVGYNTLHNKSYFNERGWVYFGLDINKDAKQTDRLIKGNFEKKDFGKIKFDLIWMSHVFEHFENPIEVLEKCYDLLTENGCLFISTPDTDAINALGHSQWGHWKKDEHNIMWNQDSLCRELEKKDFEIVLKRKNHSMRYTSWDDIHIIAHKIYC